MRPSSGRYLETSSNGERKIGSFPDKSRQKTNPRHPKKLEKEDMQFVLLVFMEDAEIGTCH